LDVKKLCDTLSNHFWLPNRTNHNNTTVVLFCGSPTLMDYAEIPAIVGNHNPILLG